MKIGRPSVTITVDVLIFEYVATLGEASTRRFIAMNHNASYDYKLRFTPPSSPASLRRVGITVGVGISICREIGLRLYNVAIQATRGNKGFSMHDSWTGKRRVRYYVSQC